MAGANAVKDMELGSDDGSSDGDGAVSEDEDDDDDDEDDSKSEAKSKAGAGERKSDDEDDDGDDGDDITPEKLKEMDVYDAHLANIIKLRQQQRKEEKGRQSATCVRLSAVANGYKSALLGSFTVARLDTIHFKLRVVDLIEIFIRKQSANVLVFRLMKFFALHSCGIFNFHVWTSVVIQLDYFTRCCALSRVIEPPRSCGRW